MWSMVFVIVVLSGFVFILVDGKGKGKGKGNDCIWIIYKDVVIIGGGVLGFYLVVRLREDYNVSVVVIEKNFNFVSFIVFDLLMVLMRSLLYFREDMLIYLLIL